MKPRRGADVLRHTVTLAVVVAAAFLVEQVAITGSPVGHLTMLVGLMLIAGGVAGRLAVSVALPRLTGYILVGMAVGPSVLGVLDAEVIHDLRFLDRFALALIGLLAGGELRMERMRDAALSIGTTTAAVTAVVAAGIALATFAGRGLVPFFSGLDPGGAIAIAVLLGIWAANSSPDLTVAVMEEVGAHGPLSDVILGVTIVKDMVVILLFSVGLAVVESLTSPDVRFGAHVLADVAVELGGAIVAGAGLGWVFSRFLSAARGRRSPMATFLFAYVMVAVAEGLHLELLILAVSAGFLIENRSPAGDRLIRDVRSLAVAVFAFFFAVAGASFDLGVAGTFWLPALLFFLIRTALTFGGARLGLRLAGRPGAVGGRVGLGLVSQGGVTLGLLLLLEAIPVVGPPLVGFGMAVVLANVLVGPVLLKAALTRPAAPGASILPNAAGTPLEQPGRPA